jgi:hypothetical protein
MRPFTRAQNRRKGNHRQYSNDRDYDHDFQVNPLSRRMASADGARKHASRLPFATDISARRAE